MIRTGYANDDLDEVLGLAIQGPPEDDDAGLPVDGEVLAADGVMEPRALGILRLEGVDRGPGWRPLGHGQPGHVAPVDEVRGPIYHLAPRRPPTAADHREEQ
jgi:hypothetical protein